MIPDNKPILFKCPEEFDEVEIYFAHDIHYGSANADIKRWDRFKRDVLSTPNRYVCMVGDYCETVITGSKGDIYSQREAINEQQLWLQQQLYDLKSHIICVTPGNHEARITKQVGLYPVFEAACIAGVQDMYRNSYAFMDIAVGKGGHGKGKQIHYVGFAAHRMKDCRGYHGADFIEGVDWVAHGHDHDPKDHARARIGYDSKNKAVYHRDIEVIDSGSFLTIYGGYAAAAGYRPPSAKLYKLVLDGTHKSIKTIGYHI